MSWYQTLSPGENLRLEFATLLSKKLRDAAPIARDLGRFRENQSLQEIGVVLESGVPNFVEYGSDGNLYLNCPQHPMTYLDAQANPMLIVKKIEGRPPVPSEMRSAISKAHQAIEKNEIAGHISGLLRTPLLEDGIKAVEKNGGKAFVMFMGIDTYLPFIAETEFEPTPRYPLLDEGIMGTHHGISVVLTNQTGLKQIYVIADDLTTVVLNCD